MATRLPDGSIRMSDGRILYSNSVILAQDLLELLPLFTPPPVWPFVSGGGGGGPGPQGPAGGGAGSQGLQGIQGNQGFQGLIGAGVQGPQGRQGLQGTNPGVQGPQGIQGLQGSGSGVQGPQGNQGLQGTNPGVQGPQGLQGPQGFQGNQGPAGPQNAAIFSFTHISGTASTGALGFTPKFAIYTGVIQETTVGVIQSTHSVGVIIGVGGSARASSMTLRGIAGTDVTGSEVSGDDDAAAGYAAASGGAAGFSGSFATSDLDVTAFSAAGIDLTWSTAVDLHAGKLLVVG